MSPASKKIFMRAATKEVQSLQMKLVEQEQRKKEEEAVAPELADLLSD
jgi:hypothetical protein